MRSVGTQDFTYIGGTRSRLILWQNNARTRANRQRIQAWHNGNQNFSLLTRNEHKLSGRLVKSDQAHSSQNTLDYGEFPEAFVFSLVPIVINSGELFR